MMKQVWSASACKVENEREGDERDSRTNPRLKPRAKAKTTVDPSLVDA